VSAGGGALFVLLAWRLYRSNAGDVDAQATGLYATKADAKPARDLFAVSILYLFALFASLLVEHGLLG
jgi:protoheme IX farnesyltransferase